MSEITPSEPVHVPSAPSSTPSAALSVLRVSASRDEFRRRRNRIIAVGVLLILSFLLPVCIRHGYYHDSGELEFVNITGLIEHPRPDIVSFMLLWPLLAGIGIILLAMYARGRVRPWALLALGFFPLLVLFGSLEGLRRFMEMFRLESLALNLFMLFSALGPLTLFVGSRARWYRPDYRPAAHVAFVGALVSILLLFVPQPFTAPNSHRTYFSIPFLNPFALLRDSETLLQGITSFLAMACLISATVLVLCSCLAKPARFTRQRAWIVSALLIAGWCISFVGILAFVFNQGADSDSGFARLMFIVKFATWGFGLLFIVLVAFVDLLVTLASVPSDGLRPDHPSTTDSFVDLTKKLEYLKKLFEAELISPEEYEREKKRLLQQL